MTQSLDGTELADNDTVVVGGTGNVGFFLVEGFLRAGARVLVPSRSEEKFATLLTRLPEHHRDRVSHLPVDVSTEAGGRALAEQVHQRAGSVAAVAASPASWHQTPTMLGAGFDDFRATIESRLYPHYRAVENLLPVLEPGGAYIFIGGPVAFMDPIPVGTGAIATATLAQSALMRAIAAETTGERRVNEVIMHAYLGPHGTRRGSGLLGEQVGDYVAALASNTDPEVHGRTLQLQTPAQVTAALAGDFG